MLTDTIDRLFQRNPRYDGHGLLGTASSTKAFDPCNSSSQGQSAGPLLHSGAHALGT